jgi:hypothetical protein
MSTTTNNHPESLSSTADSTTQSNRMFQKVELVSISAQIFVDVLLRCVIIIQRKTFSTHWMVIILLMISIAPGA